MSRLIALVLSTDGCEPEQRLRLTIGLRKAGGRWTVSHEHHSFADANP